MNFEDLIEKHSFVLPTSKKKLFLRPILVKEEKILMKKKTGDNDEFLRTILQIVDNCTINKNEMEWLKMSYNDFSYAFVKLREISRDDIVSMSLQCYNKECQYHIGNEENRYIDKKFNMEDILKIENEDNKYSKIFKYNEKYSIQLREISLEFILKLYENKELREEELFLRTLEMVIDHIDAILTEKEKVTDKDKIREFVENLKKKEIINIANWFLNEPKIKVEFKWKCEHCEKDNVFEEVDVVNFFVIS